MTIPSNLFPSEHEAYAEAFALGERDEEKGQALSIDGELLGTDPDFPSELGYRDGVLSQRAA